MTPRSEKAMERAEKVINVILNPYGEEMRRRPESIKAVAAAITEAVEAARLAESFECAKHVLEAKASARREAIEEAANVAMNHWAKCQGITAKDCHEAIAGDIRALTAKQGVKDDE